MLPDQDNLKTVLKGIAEAKNIEELESQFRGLNAYLDSLDSSQLLWSDLRQITDVLEKRIEEIGAIGDLFQGNIAERVGNLFGGFAQGLSGIGLSRAAVGILTKLWNRLGFYQSNFDSGTRHIYRAGICYYLGQIRYMERDFGEAIWWLLHAQADDSLCYSAKNVDDFHEGGACDFLRLTFGVSEDVFKYLQRRKEANDGEPDTLFAEHLVMQLSLEPSFASLFSYPTSQPEFPIGQAYAQTMLKRVKSPEPENTTQKGKALEDFVRYIVLLMSGWVPSRNLRAIRTGIDSDVVARYVRDSTSIASAHARAILIECKNIKEALNVAETGYFLQRMSLTQVEIGILFAAKNVTGAKETEAEHTNARHLLDLCFQQNGKIVILIEEHDLCKIARGETTIWSLIDSGIVERRFGTSPGGTAK